jgi:hypothetical protein
MNKIDQHGFTLYVECKAKTLITVRSMYLQCLPQQLAHIRYKTCPNSR